jgi:hypothetical protein
MAKNDTPTVAAPVAAPALTLGQQVKVMVAEGRRLVNNHTGAYYQPGEVAAATVTVTLLCRLADGDLVLVPAPVKVVAPAPAPAPVSAAA